MKKEEQIICDFIYSFVDKNYKNINLQKVESIKNKKSILEEIKNNFQDAMWIITEVAQWGMDKVYLKEIYCDIDDKYDFSVLKIDNKFIKIEYKKCEYIATFCKPKYKRVMYFD
jgi:hypothetical protein